MATFGPIPHVPLKQPPKKSKVKDEEDYAPPDRDLDSLVEHLKNAKIWRTEEGWHIHPLCTFVFVFVCFVVQNLCSILSVYSNRCSI